MGPEGPGRLEGFGGPVGSGTGLIISFLSSSFNFAFTYWSSASVASALSVIYASEASNSSFLAVKLSTMASDEFS